MGVKEIQNSDEFQQLLRENKVVAILFYQDGPLGINPLPQILSGIAGQFQQITFGQVNVDRHRWVLDKVNLQCPLQLPCLVAYRAGNVVNDSGELDPVSGLSRITGFLHKVVAEE